MSDGENPPPVKLEETLRDFVGLVLDDPDLRPSAEIPSTQVEIYRTIVHRNYLAMLRFAFTYTLRLVDHEAGDDGPDVDAVVKRFLAVAPSHTHSTREMADNFRAFLPDEYPELFERRPDLADLMSIERAELRANYHEDDPGRVLAAEEAERIVARSVDEFLGLSVTRAPSCTLLRVGNAAATLRHEIAHKRFPAPAAGTEHVTVSRRPDTLKPVVRTHEEAAAMVYGLLPGDGTPEALESLADRWMEAQPPASRSRGEEELFKTFATSVLTGLGLGVLRVP